MDCLPAYAYFQKNVALFRGIILALGIWMQVFAQNSFVPGKLFLKILPDHPQLPASISPATFPAYTDLQLTQAFRTKDSRLQAIYLLEMPAGQELAFCEAASQLSWVEYAEQIPLVENHFLPNDFDSTQMEHLLMIQALDAWELEKGSADITIAIIDNGLLTTHTDLQANLWTNPGEIPGDSIDNDANGYIDDIHGYDVADDDGDPSIPNRAYRHGSHVAGCASAVTDNGLGISAIGFGCSLMAVKIASDQGPANSYSFDQALKGVDYAIRNGADIVNMSFGGTSYSLTAQIMMEVGHERGVIFVAAAGNGPGDTNPATGDTTWEYPASLEHVISVSATDLRDKRAGIATVNSRVDVCAPGLQIRSTVPSISLGSSYDQLSGTSMSCAIVSGLLGLMLSHNPCLGPDEAEQLLKASSVPLDGKNPAWAGKMGVGRIDALSALELLETVAAPTAFFRIKDTVACDSMLELIYSPDSLAACPEQWHWQLSDGQTDTAVNARFKLVSGGLYQISLMVSNAWGIDTFSIQRYIRLSALPEVEAGGHFHISSGDTAQLMAIGNASQYVWVPATGLWPSAQIANPKAAPDTSTRYWVTATTEAGCVARDSVTIFVDPLMQLFPLMQTKISPLHLHWDGKNHQLIVKIKGLTGGEMSMNLYSMAGKKIFNSQRKISNHSASFSISFDQPLTKGIYLFVCELEGKRWSRKCMIY